ncbi:hypothetical protein GW7_07907, partial [Heterocephalus glaber]
PTSALANTNRESPVNQQGSMQTIGLGPSFILSGNFPSNHKTETLLCFRNELTLGKIFP